MSDLSFSQVEYSLSRPAKRQLREHLDRLEQIAELVDTVLKEQGKIGRHASLTVNESLATAYQMKQRAFRMNRLTPDQEALLSRLTRDYLDHILDVVAHTDRAMLNELRRFDSSLSIGRPRELPYRGLGPVIQMRS